jgi:hypothetical protein
MNAVAVLGMEEECCGCKRKFRRREQMNAMEYEDGTSAGWHCDECVELWKMKGEDALPRWNDRNDVQME